ncbi:hypothetical protein VNI00_004431 [Paramarasmius palmivorus]|uniref:Pectate lyase domain-containing protein n=1 Tax=Paramarasmius palmivorus TaxID=297713 RepID=A0AAW0DHZ3_9AGAR
MKWLASFVALFAVQSVMASPIEKRASVNDVANVGYATLNGGTSGGSGGTTTTVTSLSALQSAVQGDAKKVVIVSGTITGNTVVSVGSNTSVIGARGSQLVGVGLRALNVKNVIFRNLKISKVVADAGDAIGVQASSQVWVDHVDLSSDLSHDKASLVGHSDSNGSEDTKITVTYVGNWWQNLNSRTPSFRFGRGHIYNNFFENNNDGINTRVGAQLLVENNVWVGAKKPLYSTGEGYAVARGNDFGGASNTAPSGSFTSAPYSYSLLSTGNVRSSVTANAGQTLSF